MAGAQRNRRAGERVGLGKKKYEYYEKDGGVIYNSTKIGEKQD